MIVLGHSHPECAIDDSLVSGLKNLCKSGESPYYAYTKLLRFVTHNPQIETVYIEFSNNMIDPDYDKWIFDSNNLNYYIPLFAPFMAINDFRIFRNKPINIAECLPLISRKNLFQVSTFNFDYSNQLGGYLHLDRNKLFDQSNVIPQNPSIDHNENSHIHTHSLRYLRMMVDYCLKKKINVFLMRCPQHKLFPARSNEEQFTLTRLDLFNDIDFLDFNDYPLEDKYYGDSGHLNHHGAKVFSAFLNRLICSRSLDSGDTTKGILKQIQN
jgi:hypothetical protein